ncbi:FAD-dependent oxidoreductase [Actimicrobium sp. CCC2.4]|uniref:NAD(P)/FAD-dependent oxidoreductase n=1 Tax=Actimicrobium sp. CCC2.4 TaxID=3048606 RepID=UPI002AC9A694|nr:FAD-dependent oxidoreductase [Actimicrobium sp. CCC2.4]MEB0133945.1 FAD-dependent oxidoreductase [Actimicrobium sp. CCC2.4]WPX31484.1 FAD-dependent oxidoreductase [Actimicrobium sp. CCC2.4]
MHIAIIGAGLSGLTCARRLHEQGHSVIVYEKSHAVSGRMSTRQTDFGGFDHGAQYFTASSDTFKEDVASWTKAGWVAPWQGKFVALDHGTATEAGKAGSRHVGVPGMRSVGVHLAQGLDVRTGQRVDHIEAHGEQWLLAVHCDTVPVAASAGPFDAVIVAVPADQATALLEVVPAFAKAAKKVFLVPCWTLMAAFQDSLELGYDGAWVNNSRLSWLAHDASKPGRRPGEHWIGQASAAWSIEHLEDEPDRVREKLLKAFHEATGSQVQPVFSTVHRWRYAQAATTLKDDCLWNKKLRIGACGDWFAAGLDGAGKIENAYLSGAALAAVIA